MKYLTLILFLGLTFSVSGQDDNPFVVEVSTDTILLGNSFEVKFEVTNAKVEDFDAPRFEGFDIVAGPNQSSTMSMINGETTQSMSFSYVLMPSTVGGFYIDPASARVDGEMMETTPIEIIVLPNPDGIQQNSRFNSRSQFRWFQDDFFSNPTPSPNPKVQPKKKKKKKYKTYKI